MAAITQNRLGSDRCLTKIRRRRGGVKRNRKHESKPNKTGEHEWVNRRPSHFSEGKTAVYNKKSQTKRADGGDV